MNGLRLCLLATALVASEAAFAQFGETLTPADIATPKCTVGWDADLANGTCVANTASIGKLDDTACRAAQFDFKDNKCTLGQAKPPALACTPVSGMSAAIKDKKCVYTRLQPASVRGDFVGDCFRIVSVPPESGLTHKGIYAVTVQEAAPNNDKQLSLVEADLSYLPTPWTWGCRARIGPVYKVSASALEVHAARREGWAYGALTMPYKYFPGKKSFVAGLPIGGYLGWRWGQLGSGGTLAAALTLSQVKADTVDPKTLDADGNPTVTGTADVAALSAAFGYLFDVTKTNGGRPFKAGLFLGKDRVNASPTIRYEHNRKWWVAVQLGFDFTDN